MTHRFWIGAWFVQVWRSFDAAPRAFYVGRLPGRFPLVSACFGRYWIVAARRTEPKFFLAG